MLRFAPESSVSTTVETGASRQCPCLMSRPTTLIGREGRRRPSTSLQRRSVALFGGVQLVMVAWLFALMKIAMLFTIPTGQLWESRVANPTW